MRVGWAGGADMEGGGVCSSHSGSIASRILLGVLATIEVPERLVTPISVLRG